MLRYQHKVCDNSPGARSVSRSPRCGDQVILGLLTIIVCIVASDNCDLENKYEEGATQMGDARLGIHLASSPL